MIFLKTQMSFLVTLGSVWAYFKWWKNYLLLCTSYDALPPQTWGLGCLLGAGRTARSAQCSLVLSFTATAPAWLLPTSSCKISLHPWGCDRNLLHYFTPTSRSGVLPIGMRWREDTIPQRWPCQLLPPAAWTIFLWSHEEFSPSYPANP